MGLFLSERPSRNKAYNNLAKNIRMTKFFSLKTINFVNYIFEKEKKKKHAKKRKKSQNRRYKWIACNEILKFDLIRPVILNFIILLTAIFCSGVKIVSQNLSGTVEGRVNLIKSTLSI